MTQLELDLPPLEQFVPKHISATPMPAGYSASSQMIQQVVVNDLITHLARFKHKEGLRVPFKSYMVCGYKQTGAKAEVAYAR